MNRSLLNLLRTFVQNEGDWEQHLQLLLYIYQTTKHSSTSISPYEILFGQNPPSFHIPNFQATAILDPDEYHHQLQKKLLELRELVDSNIVQSAERQQHSYNSAKPPQLKKGQRVLLSNPTKGKLDPRWTGPWVVEQFDNSTTVRLKKENKEQVVHINWVRPLLEEDNENTRVANWNPPLFHEVPFLPTDPPVPTNSTDENPSQQLPTLQLVVAVLLSLWTTMDFDTHAHSHSRPLYFCTCSFCILNSRLGGGM